MEEIIAVTGTRFEVLSRYAATRLDTSGLLRNGRPPSVVETTKRLRAEPSFSFVRSLWWFRILGGPEVISVPPLVGSSVASWISTRQISDRLPNESEAAQLLSFAQARAHQHGYAMPASINRHLIYACDGATLKQVASLSPPATLARITATGHRYAEGIWPPEHCVPDGILFGVFCANLVVSVAYAHRTGLMENQVADLAVVTAEPHRHKGYARAVVNAVANAIVSMGGEGWYECSPANDASQATAQSAGFCLWAESLSLGAANTPTPGDSDAASHEPTPKAPAD